MQLAQSTMSPIVHCVTSSDGRGSEDSSTEADRDNNMDRYNNMDVTTDGIVYSRLYLQKKLPDK